MAWLDVLKATIFTIWLDADWEKITGERKMVEKAIDESV